MSIYVQDLQVIFYGDSEVDFKVGDFNDEFTIIAWFYYIILNKLDDKVIYNDIKKINFILFNSKVSNYQIINKYKLGRIETFEIENALNTLHNNNDKNKSLKLKLNFIIQIFNNEIKEEIQNFDTLNLIGNLIEQVNFIATDYHSNVINFDNKKVYLTYKIEPTESKAKINLILEKDKKILIINEWILDEKDNTDFFLRYKKQKIKKISNNKINVSLYDQSYEIDITGFSNDDYVEKSPLLTDSLIHNLKAG